MDPIYWLKSSCSSSCCYPVMSLFSFPPWVHTQGSKVSAAFREASKLLTLWLESGFSVMMRTSLFSFLQAFTVSKYPRLHTTRHIRRLDVEVHLLVACPLCLCPCTCLHSAWPLSLFPRKRVVISSPCFFSLSTIPIVHLSTSLSRSSYPFPHSSLQESNILHHTHFPLIHSPSHSLTYMESHGCMLSFTPSHTH